MIDKINKEGGLQPIYDQAIQDLEEANSGIKDDIKELQESAGEDFREIGRAIDETTRESLELKTQDDQLIATYQRLIKESQKLYNETLKIWQAFMSNT